MEVSSQEDQSRSLEIMSSQSLKTLKMARVLSTNQNMV